MSQREFRLVTDDTSALTRVEYEGGGEVPDALKGLKVEDRTRLEELLEPHILAQAAARMLPSAHSYDARAEPK